MAAISYSFTFLVTRITFTCSEKDITLRKRSKLITFNEHPSMTERDISTVVGVDNSSVLSKQLLEIERNRIIGLKEAGWANRRIARDKVRRDATVRRCWQEWIYSGRFQHQDGSGRPKATADREVRLTVRSAATALDSSLSIIRRAIHPLVPTMAIHRRLIERNLRSYQPLHNLPLTPAHYRTRLEWCLARSGWNHADWGHLVFSDDSRFQLRSSKTCLEMYWAACRSYFHYCTPQLGVMVWDVTSFDSRASLFVIRDTLTAQRYVV
ncbi:HTH_Tnp_Tc3_2 domain-containing protein [Trichonephila clavipes]|nr:HTH_Tnp_Tc3_2 domain-containing protein [Trichonephila clavipes]